MRKRKNEKKIGGEQVIMPPNSVMGMEPLLVDDMINHPPHYTFGKIEAIDAIEDWQLGFHEGNVVKYVARAKYKGTELDDLKKAAWYLNRRIEKMEGK
jgi:Protein of unknwon function (DUF3310)